MEKLQEGRELGGSEVKVRGRGLSRTCKGSWEGGGGRGKGKD